MKVQKSGKVTLALGALAVAALSAALILQTPGNSIVIESQPRYEQTSGTIDSASSDGLFSHIELKNSKGVQDRREQEYTESPSLDSLEDYPHDVPIEDYRDTLGAEVVSNPPQLLERSHPDALGEIAYRIYLYYWFCIRSPLPVQADKWLNDFANRTTEVSSEELENVFRQAEDMSQRVDKCLQIPPGTDRDLEAFRWLGQAAWTGHEVAQIDYYRAAKQLLCNPFSPNPCLLMRHPELLQEFKVTANRALFEAIRRGHPEAYLAMSEALLDDIIFVKNPVASLAYVKAAKFATTENPNILNVISARQNRISVFLSPDEIADAETLAHEIVIELGG